MTSASGESEIPSLQRAWHGELSLSFFEPGYGRLFPIKRPRFAMNNCASALCGELRRICCGAVFALAVDDGSHYLPLKAVHRGHNMSVQHCRT
jgi:hypothetical protein